MASDKKANKGIKADKRSKRIMGLVIAVLLIAVIGFFISVSGVLSKFIPGVKIIQTVDGKEETVESISIIECSYYFNQIKQQYTYYGLLNDETTLDTKVSEDSDKTYYEMIMDAAASQLQELVIEYNYAKNQGFDDHGAADRIAEISLEQLTETAKSYHYNSAEQFLQANYGNGMSSRIYKKIVAREAYVQAYNASLMQMEVSAEDIAAEIANNTANYNTSTFNIYYFAVDVGLDYTAEDALADAEAVKAAATDSDSFKDAVLSRLSADQAESVGFVDDANPTLHEEQTLSQWKNYLVDEIIDYVFVDGTVGEAIIVPSTVTGEGDEETIQGYYVVLVDDRYTNEEETVSYRVLTLESTPETVNDVVAKANELKGSVTDEDSFMKLIVDNSSSANEIGTAGFVSGRTRAAFESTVTNEDGTTSTTVSEPELVNWLFDATTVSGSMTVQAAADGNSVKIIYLVDRVSAAQSTARSTILSDNAETIETIITTANQPSYRVSYGLIRHLGYID